MDGPGLHLAQAFQEAHHSSSARSRDSKAHIARAHGDALVKISHKEGLTGHGYPGDDHGAQGSDRSRYPSKVYDGNGNDIGQSWIEMHDNESDARVRMCAVMHDEERDEYAGEVASDNDEPNKKYLEEMLDKLGIEDIARQKRDFDRRRKQRRKRSSILKSRNVEQKENNTPGTHVDSEPCGTHRSVEPMTHLTTGGPNSSESHGVGIGFDGIECGYASGVSVSEPPMTRSPIPLESLREILES